VKDEVTRCMRVNTCKLMLLGAALGVSMATTSAALADCGWLSACTVTNELCVVTYTHNRVVVSTFHDDNIRETRISMLCASCLELTTANCSQ